MDNKEFENISLIEAPRKMQILSKEANQRIAFNWKISCFKALQLMKGLVSNFENDNHYIALILLRNFSEVSSMLYYTYKKIEPLVEEINSTNSNKKYFEIHDKLEAISRTFSYS